MEQLSGLDAAFIHQDSARTPMHVTAVLFYDAGEQRREAISRPGLRDLVQQRLGHFPLFRRKLRRVLMDVDTPYWIDVERPDIGRQISGSSLTGGGWEALRERLQDLHGERMDLARPLWEMHLLSDPGQLPGLPRHCQVLILKVHHAAIDGMSLAAIIDALHRHTSEASPGLPPEARELSRWDLWARVGLNNMGRQFKLAETVGNLLPGINRARQSRQAFSDLPPILRRKARFNARVTGRRSVGVAYWPMAEVIAIRRAVRRVTFNDIALTVVAGALRQYLSARGELPDGTLSCGAPINLRTPGDAATGGNRIATMNVGLATHVEDPVERLRLVHRYAVAGKKQLTALGSGTIMDISDSLAPNILSEGLRTMAWASRLADTPVPYHTMVSNVPGPAAPMFLGEARLVMPAGLGPVRDNMGLFHIVSNSESMFSLAFNACRSLLPDGGFYESCLDDAFRELQSAAQSA